MIILPEYRKRSRPYYSCAVMTDQYINQPERIIIDYQMHPSSSSRYHSHQHDPRVGQIR